MLGVGELKWTGMRYFQSGNYKAFYSGHDKIRRNGVALILKQDVAQAVREARNIPDHVFCCTCARISLNSVTRSAIVGS